MSWDKLEESMDGEKVPVKVEKTVEITAGKEGKLSDKAEKLIQMHIEDIKRIADREGVDAFETVKSIMAPPEEVEEEEENAKAEKEDEEIYGKEEAPEPMLMGMMGKEMPSDQGADEESMGMLKKLVSKKFKQV